MIEIKNYGFESDMLSDRYEKTKLPFLVARVVAVHKERYELICEYGQTYGRLKKSIYYGLEEEIFPTTGDFVFIDYNPSGDSRITKTLKRKSYFSRLDPSSSGNWEQAVAANFDYVFIVASLNQDFNLRRIERYLTLTWQSGAVPVVILTKADLVEDYTEQVQKIKEISPDVDICAISSKTGYGLEKLIRYLCPRKTIVFLGSSGVGKSSLVNALSGEEVMSTNDIRELDSRGRHTTTHRQLIMLESGVMVIDTPGMRELGMWDVSLGLGQSFSDIEQFFGKCKFSDCNHQAEPGCAVKSALESGELSHERWNSYLKLKREAKYSDNKSAYLREIKSAHKSRTRYYQGKDKRK